MDGSRSALADIENKTGAATFELWRKCLPTAEPTVSRELSISVSEGEGGVMVLLSGRVSIDSSPAIRDRLLEIFGRGHVPTLTIDLTGVSHIDLSGIATLLEALKISRGHQTLLQLRGLHNRPRYLLEVTGLLGLFETHGRIINSPVSEVL
jgi:anti-sigma B factor antagonist